MKIADFDTDEKVLIIAEIGNNHEGSYALAEKLIGLAVEAGANAVKFQTYKTEYYVSRRDRDRFERLKSFELSQEEFKRLSSVARDSGLLFISTPFDIDSALFLSGITDALKIASGDNNFYPLIETVAHTGRPVIMSTGLADLKQVVKSRQVISDIWEKKNIKQNLAVLHCVSAYPVEPVYANLNAIQSLKNRLDCTVGYSDHTLGIEAAIVSVGLGARIIEKHFTLNKHYSDFRDHQISADPAELKDLVEKVNNVFQMLGSGEKKPQPPEQAVVSQIRRSIVAKNDLSKGTVLRVDDLAWIRPAGGLAPGEEDKLIGKVLKLDIGMGEQVLIKHVT